MDTEKKKCLVQNKKMSLKIKVELFEDKKKFSSLCLRTSKTLSLNEFDESKTLPFLSSFLMHI